MTMTILAGSAVKAAIVVLLAVAAALALRRSSAAMRHWVLAVGIGCALAAPALALAVPAWAISLPASAPRASSASPSSSIAAPVSKRGEVSTETTIAIDRAALPPTAPRNPSVVGLLVAVWLAGSVALTSMLLIGFIRLERLAASARVVGRGRWFRCAAEIARAEGIRRPILLLQSDHPALLVTWGWRRPRVILPSAAHEWDDERMRIVLRHELAHIGRGDWAAQLVAELLRCCYWFNPLVWIACRQLRRESERACDDEVLRAGIDPADYASHLLDLARLFNVRRVERRTSIDSQVPGMAMARPSSLEGRISAMLNAHLDRRPLPRALQAATAGLFLAATLSIAGAAQARYSTFSGTVVDPTNAFLPNTTLVLTNNGSKARHEVKSDSTGRFEFVGLPPGDYTLQVGQMGFATLNEPVSITRDVARTIELQVASLEETIRIVAGGSAPAAADPERAAKLQSVRQKAQERQQRATERCEGVAGGGVGGNILQPWKITDVRPVYPATASSTHSGGVVTMEAVIGTDGTVREVHVISSPHPDLDRAAADAVRQWEFTPTMLNCTPIEVRMKVTASFVAP